MRILQIHNHYKVPGGEDQMVDRERDLLVAHGHHVVPFTVTNDTIRGVAKRLAVAWNTAYSRTSRARVAAAIAEIRPDVAHVHNTFPLLTPAIYDACRDAGVPVVQTLHNYRLICAAATFSRNDRVCEDCLGASPYQAVLHKCYRGSRLGSLAVARMIDVHRRRRTWCHKVDRFIAPSAFVRAQYVAAGFPADRIVIKRNFVPGDDAPEGAADTPRSGALYVGRLSAEKGIGTLIDAWRDCHVPLTVIGDGPLRHRVEAASAANANVSVLGYRPSEHVGVHMRRASFLVMPSEWYEGQPSVIIEAFCRGLPVIASRLGAMAEMVEDGVTGFLFAPGDAASLLSAVDHALADPVALAAMGRRARRHYESSFSPAPAIGALEAVYRAVLQPSERPGGG